MRRDEARNILHAATSTWAVARIAYDEVKLQNLSYSEQRLGRPSPELVARQELKMREEILDAAVQQYVQVMEDTSGRERGEAS